MSKIITWIKIGKHFINQDNIRSIIRFGNATKICRIVGEDIIVKVNYDKIKLLLPKSHH